MRSLAAIATVVAMGLAAVTAGADNAAPYIYYLHGAIIEDKGTTPKHPRWGLYDYPAVVDALGSKGGTVISEARASGTEPYEYAVKTAENVEELIDGGIQASDIVVVGFSKGGAITILASGLVDRPEIRYVLLAACSDWIASAPQLRLTGRVLSIVEESDPVGKSCQDLADRGGDLKSFREIQISTNKEHGAFYLPHQEWVDPLLNWIHDPE